MTGFNLIALVCCFTALFSYLNYRFIKLPTTIGVMLMALMVSLCLIGLRLLGLDFETTFTAALAGIQFDKTLMQGMLSFLLFAGALHINLNDLLKEKIAILILATVGVLLSTFATGAGLYYSLQALHLQLAFVFCLLFGALISPTDPIAVLSILKIIKVPKSLEIKIAGESLFNDGIGVILFTILAELAVEGDKINASHVGILFLEEAVGGMIFGLVIGWLAYLLLKSVDNYQVEILLTLALVTGGYALASAIHTSGPIAIVVAGLLVGNHGRKFAMSQRTREHLDGFWALIDEFLNTVLFVLIGLEVLSLKFTSRWLLAGLAVIPVLLMARWISVLLPTSIMRFWRKFSPGAVTILTWSGLRGGIPVALALSLPSGDERDLLLAVTYIVVIFSVVVQGLTIERVIKYFYPDSTNALQMRHGQTKRT